MPTNSVDTPPTATATPAKPRLWPQRALGLMLGAVIALMGFKFARAFPDPVTVGEFSKAQKLGLMALCVPATFFGILMHELGHVAGGKLAGFRFLLLLVGPLKLQRTPTGLRFGLNRSASLAGGLACLVPEDDRNHTRRMALFIAGGPAASLLLGLAAGVAGWVWYRQFTPQAPASYGALLGSLGLVILGAISMALFLVSALPMSAGGFATDGRRLWMLTRKGPGAERETALVLLLNAAISGVRARDYPAHLVTCVAEHDDSSALGLTGKLMAYYHWLDRNEPARAGALLGAVLAGTSSLPRMTRESVHAEHAYWLAVHGGDAVAARAALALAGRGGIDPSSRLRAEAAVLRAEGDVAAASAKADAALDALRRRGLGLTTSADQIEWIEALRSPVERQGIARIG